MEQRKRIRVRRGGKPCPECGAERVRGRRDRNLSRVIHTTCGLTAVVGVVVVLMSVPFGLPVTAGLTLSAMSLGILALWRAFRGPTFARLGWVYCASCRSLEVGGRPAPELAAFRRRGAFWFTRIFWWMYLPALFYGITSHVARRGGFGMVPEHAPAMLWPAIGMLVVATVAGVASRVFVPMGTAAHPWERWLMLERWWLR